MARRRKDLAEVLVDRRHVVDEKDAVVGGGAHGTAGTRPTVTLFITFTTLAPADATYTDV